jgi:hypothetical protein
VWGQSVGQAEREGIITRNVADLGALGGTRTPNLLIRSQMLYPLSYERRADAAGLRRRLAE